MRTVPVFLLSVVLLVTGCGTWGENRTETVQPHGGAANRSLEVGGDGHYLVRKDGSPFFWLADTGWALFTRTRDDIALYLRDRVEKGFTVIQAMAIRTRRMGLYYTTPDGETPFTSVNPVTLNEAYWTHVDYIVDKAEELGLYVVLFSMWGHGADTLFPDSATNNREYGYLLGRRYAGRQNVLFSVMGEYNKVRFEWNGSSWDKSGRPGNVTPEQLDLVRQVALGLEAGHGGSNLMTIHPDGGWSSSRHFHAEPWLDFNMEQTYGARAAQNLNGGGEMDIGADYALVPAKPVLNGEPAYEDREAPCGGGWKCDAWHLRLDAYWSVFSGAFGFTYGADSIWQFGDTWRRALDLPGATQMRYLKNLMESRPMLTRVPDDTIVVSSLGSYSDKAPTRRVATLSPVDGYAFVYSTQGNSFRVDLSRLSGGTINAWWYNPRTGTVHDSDGAEVTGPFESFSTDDTEAYFNPPGVPRLDNDWVLILDDASRAYGAPRAARGWSRR